MTPAASEYRLRILVVDDGLANVRKTLAMSLEADGHAVVAASNAQDAVGERARQPFDLAFVDLRLGVDRGLDLLPNLLAQSPWMCAVIITARHASVDTAETMKRGAVDYLAQPFTPRRCDWATQRVGQWSRWKIKLPDSKVPPEDRTQTPSLRATVLPCCGRLSSARQTAQNDTTVLLRGESGTGERAWSCARFILRGVLAKSAIRDRLVPVTFTAAVGE